MARIHTFRHPCERCNDYMVYAAVKVKRFCPSCQSKPDICIKCGRKILDAVTHEYCNVSLATHQV